MRSLAAVALLAAAAFAEEKLLVLHKGASSLGFYTSDGKLQAAVPVGEHPHEMVVSADGRTLFTTDNGTMAIEQAGTGGNTVSVVDLRARKRAAQIDLGRFRRPHGIDLDRQTGRLYVTTELPDQLLVIDTASRKVVRTYETKGKTSHMITLSRDRRWAFVSNAGSANVAAIELVTGYVKLIPSGARPEGSALSPDGKRLYVASREGAQVSIIDTVRQEPAGAIATGKEPVRIAVTPDGRTLVYALKSDRAVEFADAVARKVLGSVQLGGEPVSLSLSRDGRLAYAAAQDIDTVYVVSIADRKLVREFKTAAGANPDPVRAVR